MSYVQVVYNYLFVIRSEKAITHKMQTLIVVLSIVTVALATAELNNDQGEKPRRCCVPRTFQVNIGGSEAFEVLGTATHGLVKFFYQYAIKSQELAAVRIMNMETYQEAQRLVIVYSNHTLYNITGSSCVKSRFEAPPPERCLPASATFLANLRLGGGRDFLDARYWKVMNTTLQMEEGISFTRNCYPIGSDTSVTVGKVRAYISVGYLNMVNHIMDRSIFVIPESCKNSVAVDLPWKHFIDHPHLPKAMFARF